MEHVAAWLQDRALPAPTAADLAAHVAHEEGVSRFAGGGARAALLRLAAIVVALDGFLKDSLDKRRALVHAMQDSARTAVLALERLQQQEPLVLAAIAWREAFGTDGGSVMAIVNASNRLRDEADKAIAFRGQRS